jgi:threonine/homoserine efflux transporter RhtA
MMAAAALVSLLQGATFNNTVFPMVLSLGATSVAILIVALTLVRKYGHV